MNRSKPNQFKFTSLFDEVEKDLEKGERKQRRKATNHFKKALRRKIKSKGLVDKGNLLKGVKHDEYSETHLVGIAAPGFHAHLHEFGTVKMKKTPFFLETFREQTANIIKIQSEPWL